MSMFIAKGKLLPDDGNELGCGRVVYVEEKQP